MVEIGDQFMARGGPLIVYSVDGESRGAGGHKIIGLLSYTGQLAGCKFGIPENELGTKFPRFDREPPAPGLFMSRINIQGLIMLVGRCRCYRGRPYTDGHLANHALECPIRRWYEENRKALDG